jgi:hypothetical protein
VVGWAADGAADELERTATEIAERIVRNALSIGGKLLLGLRDGIRQS